jgi:signal transduction histidine kinase
VAIGEFYEFDTYIRKEIYDVEAFTWILILLFSLIIILLIYFIARRFSRTIGAQQELLEQNFSRAAALAKRNNALRRAADRARLNAAALNETYLASIGADIHDGPIQILSLMMLKLPRATEQGEQPADLAKTIRQNLEPLIQKTLAELRNLSAGLVLPELDHLSAAETIDLAAKRHEEHTGTRVARDLVNLPKHAPRAVRVCAYRIIQEALNNSYKHAGGRGQRVTARLEGRMLEIAVADSGAPSSSQPHSSTGSEKLGLRGMESRVKALRGSLAIVRLQNGGTEIRASLPVRS